MDYVKLGERLREARKNKSLTQLQLAELSGVDNKYISKIECGKAVISLELMVRLANSLDVSPNFLLQDSLSLQMYMDSMEEYMSYDRKCERDKGQTIYLLNAFSKFITSYYHEDEEKQEQPDGKDSNL